jgi:hypothetical protein
MDRTFGLDWSLKPLKGLTVWEASVSGEIPEIKLEALYVLFGIPEWSIDAELLYMNWREK